MLDRLRELPDESIHCVVTSPPYFRKRDYGVAPTAWPEVRYRPLAGLDYEHVTPAQCVCLGLETDPMDYIAHLVLVFREVRRVLVSTGVIFLNIGDKYVASAGNQQGKTGQRANRKFTTATIDACGAFGLPRKSLCGIPQRVVLALQAAGWIWRGENIWHKTNAFLDGARDRCTMAHEPVYLLSKQPMHYANMDAVRQPYAESTMRELAAEVYNGKPKKDYASSGAQNPSDAKARFIKRHSIRAGVDNKGGGQGSGQIEIKDLGGSNLRTVWPIPTQASNGEHTAAFPDRLAELCILMGCPPGGVVLDLFGGSGTTITVSLRHGRSALMIELNPKYCEMARRRIINDNPLFNTPALAPSTSPALKEAPAP